MYPQFMEFSVFSRHWVKFLTVGMFLFALGCVALANSCVATFASVLMLGWVLMAGGISQIAAAFLAKQWSGFFPCLLMGILYAVAGLLVIVHPLASAAGLTLLLSVLFLTGGLCRVMVAVTLWYPGWGWAVCDGMLTLVLGGLIWAGWPSSAIWVIGTFLGISLLFHGLWWVMFAFAARQVEAENSPSGYYQ